ncbi:PA2778 family cysteine peptidase [Thermithiobacillus tepidarius DSM 3134]|uniref:PA2778 family cysteine peptidase n=1 Tax=Thermithiobacillus tepidarius TaxID=929 RepID=UPI000420302D|nr:PA2778 family cysteine peptidase [Thermithiobacillus tepidarius]
MGRLWSLFLLVAVLSLVGCASTPQSDRLLGGPASMGGLPPRQELTQVPFFPQEALQCGPASLAMAMNYLPGAGLTPEALLNEVYTPGRAGSLQMDLIGAARRHGALAYVIRPDLEDLLREMAAGHPVIILQNLAFNWYPRWHYAVVVGYDLGSGDLILRSGREARQLMPLRVFERTWARGGRWGLLVLPPTALPATAQQEPFLTAALGLEKARRWAAAAQAYETALKRWPDSLGAALGLGNSRYADGDRPGAVQAFWDGLAKHPDSAVLHNNLAQTLLDLKKPSDALPHAQKAVELDAGNPAFRDTLAAVRTALATFHPDAGQ